MRKVIGAAFVSLDGVMQAPGGPEEDQSGGFKFGGWMAPISDEEVGAHIGQLFEGDFDLLLGRRTYDIFAAYWPFFGDEGEDAFIARSFNKAAKYVVTGGEQPLDWANSHRLADLGALARLKATDGPDLVIQGSSTLYPQLLAAGLIDRMTLMIFPVVLGRGKRLLDGETSRSLKLVEHKVTPGGVVIAAYEPAGPVATGSFGELEPGPAELARRQKIADGVW